jgi:hypothetical protein
MLDFGKVIEVDEYQVGPRVVATRVDDRGGADAVEECSGKFGAFVDVSVQRQAGLVFLDPTPQSLTADVAAIEEHIAVSIEGRRVDDRDRMRGVLDLELPEFLLDAGQGIQVRPEILDYHETAWRPNHAAIGI